MYMYGTSGAERTARALYHFGYSSLSDSEINMLQSDKGFHNLVMAYVEILKKNDMLSKSDQSIITNKKSYSQIDDPDVERIFLKQFKLDDMLFEVRVSKNKKTLRNYLQMKRWSHLTEEVYSHEMLLETYVKSTDIDNIKRVCKDELSSCDYCSSDIDQALSKW